MQTGNCEQVHAAGGNKLFPDLRAELTSISNKQGVVKATAERIAVLAKEFTYLLSYPAGLDVCAGGRGLRNG